MGTAGSTPLRYVRSLVTADAAFGAGLLLSPDGTKLYVSNTTAGNVYVLGTADGALVQTIALCSSLGKMAFLGDNLLIADDEGKRLVEVTPDGVHVRSIPTQYRVSAVAANSSIIVAGRCDWEEEAAAAAGDGSESDGRTDKRVLVYSADAGKFLRAFASWGAGPGQVRICAAAHFTSDGLHLVLAGAAVGEGLHVFTPEGVFVRRVLAGSSIGGPMDFCSLGNNLMVVADANGNAVHAYSKTDFKLVQTLHLGEGGEGSFACPTALAASGQRIYILNRHCNRIDVFAF